MAAPNGQFTLDRGRIRIADRLLVYLERAFAPREPLPPGAVPRSHGVVPIAVSGPDAVAASIAPGEAMWLGFQAIDRTRPVTVRVRVEGATPIDAVTGEPWQDELAEAPRNHLICPPDTRLAGVLGTRESPGNPDVVGELSVLAWVPMPVTVAVTMLRPTAFTGRTGQIPEPIDPGSAYRGERLP